MKGVPFVNRRYTKGVTFSWKMVYKKVRALNLGAQPSRINVCWVPPPGKKLGSNNRNKPFWVLCCRSSCWNLPLSIAFLLGVFTRCSCACESMKPMKQWEIKELDRNSLSSFGEACDMSPRLTRYPRWRPCHEKVSSLFIFRFLFFKKAFFL